MKEPARCQTINKNPNPFMCDQVNYKEKNEKTAKSRWWVREQALGHWVVPPKNLSSSSLIFCLLAQKGLQLSLAISQICLPLNQQIPRHIHPLPGLIDLSPLCFNPKRKLESTAGAIHALHVGNEPTDFQAPHVLKIEESSLRVLQGRLTKLFQRNMPQGVKDVSKAVQEHSPSQSAPCPDVDKSLRMGLMNSFEGGEIVTINAIRKEWLHGRRNGGGRLFAALGITVIRGRRVLRLLLLML